jgi:tRNA(adenine34) deaminase
LVPDRRNGYSKIAFSLYFCNITFKILDSNRDEFFMRAAIEEAKRALERQEVPVGAIVVCNDLVIARAHNLTETLNDPTAHAEMQAITAAANYLGGKYLTDCTIYVTVEPCPMCAGALAWSQVTRLVYGCDDEKRGYSLIPSLLLHPRTEVKKGVLAAECASLMKSFFRAKR